MQGECQRTIGASYAFSMIWKWPKVHILLQGGKLIQVGTPLRFHTNRPLRHSRYFQRLCFGALRLVEKLPWHKRFALGIAKRRLWASLAAQTIPRFTWAA